MDLKTFMNTLWGAEGSRIVTRNFTGVIENVRPKAGTDLKVLIVLEPSGNAGVFSGEQLFALDAEIH